MAASASLLRATISFSPSRYHPLQRNALPSSFKPYLSSPSMPTHHPTFQPLPPLLPPFPPHRLIITIFADDMYDETQKGFGRRRCTAGERFELACNGTRSFVHGHAGHAGAGGGSRTFKTDSSTSSSSLLSQPSYSSSTSSSRPSYYSHSSSSIYSRPSDSSHSSSDSRSSSLSSNYSSTRLATLEALCMAMQAMQAPVVAAGPSSPIPPLRLLRRRPSLATLLLLHHLGPATTPLRRRLSTLALQIPPTRLATLDHLPLRLTTHPTRRRPRPTTLALNRRGLPPPLHLP